MPPSGKPVLAHGRDNRDNTETIRAMYVSRYSFEIDDDDEFEAGEFDANCEFFFLKEGWYERNLFDEINWKVELEITHWMPLPEPPGIQNLCDLCVLDVAFLANRCKNVGRARFYDGEHRDIGLSSNSIVSIAYGLADIKDQKLPHDDDDLNACERMWEKLPDHRKCGDAMVAMERARNYRQLSSKKP